MVKKVFKHFKLTLINFIDDQRGVTAVEYAIIGVSISAVILVMFNGELQDALLAAVQNISDNINAAQSNGN
ncbi:Flp family type IVb pilin [bacterium]|nr:Flp family type IVb pilin [bacterium]